MFNLLWIPMWLTLLGTAIRWGNGWWIAGVVATGIAWLIFLYRRRRKKIRLRCSRPVPEIPFEQFLLPRLDSAGPFLEDPKLDGTLLKEEKAELALKDKAKIGLQLIIFPGTPILLMIVWNCNAKTLIPIGAIFCLFILTTAAIDMKRRLRLTRRGTLLRNTRDSWLTARPRPPWQWNRNSKIDRFCRYFKTSREAKAACILAKLAGIDFLVYPQDSLRIAAGSGYPQMLDGLEKYGIPLPPATFGDAARALSHRLDFLTDTLPEDLPIPSVTAEPPPLSEAMVQIQNEIRREEWKALCEDLFHAEIRQRPVMTERAFCACWKTAADADVALRIRQLAIEHLEREKTMMCYPNDPVQLLFYIDNDSLDTMGLLMAMENEFGIRISDAEAARMLSQTFAELVAFVREQQQKITDVE